MSLIGVRELREQTSEAIQLDAGRAEKEMVQTSKKAVLDSWERYERLAEELRRDWPADLSTQDVIDSIRG